MALVTLSADGPAAADVAWERYLVPALWPTWSPQIRGTRGFPDRLVAGARGTVLGPPGVSVAAEVLAVDEAARTWEWVARRGPVRLRLEHSVAPLGDGSRTSLTIHGLAPVVAAYAPLAYLAIRRLVRA